MIVVDRYTVRVRAFEATPTNVRFSLPTTMANRDTVASNTLRFGKMKFVPTWAAPRPVPSGSPVYPVAGHVRYPDTFGPTGADYQGTERLPVAADVKTGTGYGADSTEYTGTLAAGSGVSRSRAVN